MREAPPSLGSGGFDVSRGVHVVLAATLCIIVASSCFDGVTAQPTLEAYFCRERYCVAEGDSVKYDQPLRANYAWGMHISGQAAAPGTIEVLTPHEFRYPSREPKSTEREDSKYRYTWETPNLGEKGLDVHLDSDLEVTFAFGFDSEVAVSPEILEEKVTDQTLKVKVTPRESFSGVFVVDVDLQETEEAKAELIPNTDQANFEQGEEGVWVEFNVHDPTHASWKVGKFAVGEEYDFSVQFRTENKPYPNKVLYKPMIHITFYELPYEERTLEGPTVVIEDNLLGTVSFSTPSPSRWKIVQDVARHVQYELESYVWGVRTMPIATTESTVAQTSVPSEGILEGYSVFLAAIAIIATTSFMLFWLGRTRPMRRPAAAPPAKMHCIFCAAPIEPDQEFCTRCGKRQIRV